MIIASAVSVKLKDEKMAFLGTLNCIECYARIEGDEATTAFDGKGQEVNIGQLARALNTRKIRNVGIEQTNIVCPEFMKFTRGSFR